MKKIFIASLLFFACITVNAQQNSTDAKKKANPLASKYPQGVTEETKKVDNCIVTSRVVVKGENAWVYERKRCEAKTTFYKDGTVITNKEWEAETKP
ncbi:MAG: hypothetical protein ACHQII_03145 [Bacteroidia bacterium]